MYCYNNMLGKKAGFWVCMLLLIGSCKGQSPAQEKVQNEMETKENRAEIVIGGGCFWCVEAVMQRIKGVEKVESGYTGGTLKNPNYREICTGKTGHAEVVKVTFDSSVVSLKTLLMIFMTTHDPTTLNRQGADVGTQYRSVIYFGNETQQKTAVEVIKALTEEQVFSSPIVTEISPLDSFYRAEDYHQDYFNNNTSQPYCQYVIEPKVQKLRERYKEYLK